jgi:putative protease
MVKVELLAPAGKPDILKSVIEAGADAVYLGGKNFNMRQHRSDFNFDLFQLKKAVEFVHQKGKKIYITANALFKDEEFSPLKDYLDYLNEINVDAIIIQDLGLLHVLIERQYNFAIHASTMMNIHNIDGAKLLKSKGVSRIITSRDISLDHVMTISQAAGIECEYFIHGDMCASQSGLCYSSGILFGQSSNRGRCLKSCRWPYQFYDITKQKPLGKKKYYLARKDMCLVRHIDTLISKGIASLKIEGRMKDEDFLCHIIMSYRKLIDTYYTNPYLFNTSPDVLQDVHKKRIRDLCTCFALKEAGMETLGLTGKKEPKFFSRAVKEKRIEKRVNGDQAAPKSDLAACNLSLTIHVATLDTFTTALSYKPGWIYLDTHLPVGYWDEKKMTCALKMAREHEIPVALYLPPVMHDSEIKSLHYYLDNSNSLKPDAFLAGGLGAVEAFRKRDNVQILADYTLNIINSQSVLFLKELGVTRYCLSPEFPSVLTTKLMESELLVHGPLPFMQFERCYIYTIKGKNKDYCPGYCKESTFGFMDDRGEIHELVPDTRCRNYFISGTHLCLINSLNNLIGGDIKYLRIDARLYDPAFTDFLLHIYGSVIKEIAKKGQYHLNEGEFHALIEKSRYPLGVGAYCRHG